MTNVTPLKSIYKGNTVIGLGEFNSTDTISNNYLEYSFIEINGYTVNLGESYTSDTPLATTISAGTVQLNDTISNTSVTLAATANSVNAINNIVSTKLSLSGGKITGNVDIEGNLSVTGNIANFIVNTLEIADDIIEIRKGPSLSEANSGIKFNMVTNSSGTVLKHKSFGWNKNEHRFFITNGEIDKDVVGAIATNKDDLSFFANTTSANLKNIITDSTGNGSIVFSNNAIMNNLTITNALIDGKFKSNTYFSIENGVTASAIAYNGSANVALNVSSINASSISIGTLPNERLKNIPNSALQNNAITINNTKIELGNSGTITVDSTLPVANLTIAGIVQLNDTINSSSNSLAATANSVKIAYDLANTANINASNASVLITGTIPDERLSNTTVIFGTYGSSNTIPVIVVDPKGRLSNVTNNVISISTQNITGLANSATIDTTNADNITSGTLLNDRLKNIPNSALQNSSVTIITGNGLSGGGTVSLGSEITITSNSASITASGIVQLNDDITNNSIGLAATANTVKTVYDLTNTKLNIGGGTINGDLSVSGNITGTLINSASNKLNYAELFSGSMTINNNNDTVTLDSVSAQYYRSLQYWIQISQNKNFHYFNLSVLHDGTTTYSSKFDEIFNVAKIGTITAEIQNNNIVLQYSNYGDATTQNITIKFVRMSINI